MAQITVGRAMAFGLAKQPGAANTGTTVYSQEIIAPGTSGVTHATGFTGTMTTVAAGNAVSFTITPTYGALGTLAVNQAIIVDAGTSVQETVYLLTINTSTGVGTANFRSAHTTPTVSYLPGAPTWIRWLQGSSHYPEGQFNHEWEGDGSRGESIAWKRFQSGKFTHITYPRPIDMAYLLQAFVGNGSNTVTPPIAATTTAVTAGNNRSFTLSAFTTGTAASLLPGALLCFQQGTPEVVQILTWNGSTGVGTANFVNNHGAASAVSSTAINNFVATSTAIAATGTQSFVLTFGQGNAADIVAGISTATFTTGTPETVTIATWNAGTNTGTATFANTHTSGLVTSPITSPPSVHTICYPAIDQGNDYYTATSFLRGSTYCLQSFDALCYRLTISGSVGQPIKVQSEWVGGGNQYATAPTSIVLGGSVWGGNVVSDVSTTSDGPYYHLASSIAAQLFTFGNLGTINAAIKDFTITMEAQLSAEDFASEYVFPLPLVNGNVTVTGEVTMLWQDSQAMALAYFGTTSPSVVSGTGSDILTTTAPTTGSGDFQIQVNSSQIGGTANATHTFTLEIPNATYESVIFEPDLAGKPIEQKMTLHGLKNGTYQNSAFTSGVPSTSIFAARVKCAAPAAF